MATPTLIQQVRQTASNDWQGAAPTFPLKLQLPNLSTAGNCLILGFTRDVTAGVTVTVTDDKSNTWTAGPDVADTNQHCSIFYSLNIASGTRVITVTFTGGTPGFVQGNLSEFSNIATSAVSDGTSTATPTS